MNKKKLAITITAIAVAAVGAAVGTVLILNKKKKRESENLIFGDDDEFEFDTDTVDDTDDAVEYKCTRHRVNMFINSDNSDSVNKIIRELTGNTEVYTVTDDSIELQKDGQFTCYHNEPVVIIDTKNIDKIDVDVFLSVFDRSNNGKYGNADWVFIVNNGSISNFVDKHIVGIDSTDSREELALNLHCGAIHGFIVEHNSEFEMRDKWDASDIDKFDIDSLISYLKTLTQD